MNKLTDQKSSSISQFGIYKKVLILTLSISITPMLLFGLFTLVTLDNTTEKVVNEISTVIDQNFRETIELQAVLTARSVERFLKQRENDLRDLAELIPTDRHYYDFARLHKGEIWVRTGTRENPSEIQYAIPIYKEISFIDANGWEKVKISNNQVVPKNDLKKVSDPDNTLYGIERYFEKTAELKSGEIYVSHLTGYHLSEKEQLAGASTIEEAVDGPVYDGIIRFSAPLYNDTVFLGVVTLAMDHRHLMEFTQHILPNSKEQTVFPVYSSGNYAFMFDDNGWIITHPKYWDFPGIDSSGNWVEAYNENSSPEAIAEGRIPFNLDTAGFVHPNYPLVAQAVRRQESGSVITTNIGGVRKVMAYAPILYSSGPYSKHGVFGGITIGAELEQFQELSSTVADDMSKIIFLFRDNIALLIVFTFLLTALASWLFSRGLTRPIVRITEYVRQLAEGDTVTPLPARRNDEIGILAKTFNHMAGELDANKKKLLSSLESLRQSKTEIENYSKDLEYQLTIFQSIQRISDILGSSLDLDTILKYILQNCVESLNYDRAVLYLLDSSEQYLEYREMYGLTEEEERRAKRSRYDLSKHDCIETKVHKNGEIIFVPDFNSYTEATEFDKRIHQISKSNSFVYVPLKVKEKVIGIMGADRLRSKTKITELDINSLQILANQASRIIETTRLYQEIIQQSDFVEDIISNMIKGVVTVDSDGKITSVNQAARSILEIDQLESKVLNLDSLFGRYPDLVKGIKQYLTDNTAANKPPLEIKIEENRKFMLVTISGIAREDSVEPNYIILIEDFTDRKRMDDHLHQLDRLASLGRFAAGIAHEIRNPLTGISVFLDDMHDKISSQPDSASFLTMAILEIERLDQLVNELLDYASPSGARLALKDINDIISTTLRFTAKQCRQNNIRVDVALENNLPQLLIDSEKIRQALLNIILNAIQVLEKDGIIRIRTDRIDDSSPSAPIMTSDIDNTGWVRIHIEDSGPGIKEEDRKNIFEPFYTKRHGGTGLGLSITQSIISEHDGKIQVDKSSLNGACFTIYLPVRKQPSPSFEQR